MEGQNLMVMVRVRPLLPEESGHESAVETTDSTTVCTIKGRTITPMCFDRVFGSECSQGQVYQGLATTVQSVLDGFNATIFAYGQTGTGKTHTMLGLSPQTLSALPDTQQLLQNEHKGLIPRSVEHIFERVEADTESEYWLHCSYLEIYNERVLDLLDSASSQGPGLEIREDKQQGVFVPELRREAVQTASQVFSLLLRGAGKRVISRTDANEHSSRSHTVFLLSVARKVKADPEQPLMHARLNLVDLAGSEKWRTHSVMGGQRVTELTAINQSLSTLGKCIKALSEPARQHIPFRDSKLTRLLQDSLGGNCKTAFIATVSPSALSLEETGSTLKFADRARRVVSHPVLNEELTQQVQIARLERRVRQLAKANQQLESKLASEQANRGVLESALRELKARPGGPALVESLEERLREPAVVHRVVELLLEGGPEEQLRQMQEQTERGARELEATKSQFVREMSRMQQELQAATEAQAHAEAHARALEHRLGDRGLEHRLGDRGLEHRLGDRGLEPQELARGDGEGGALIELVRELQRHVIQSMQQLVAAGESASGAQASKRFLECIYGVGSALQQAEAQLLQPRATTHSPQPAPQQEQQQEDGLILQKIEQRMCEDSEGTPCSSPSPSWQSLSLGSHSSMHTSSIPSHDSVHSSPAHSHGSLRSPSASPLQSQEPLGVREDSDCEGQEQPAVRAGPKQFLQELPFNFNPSQASKAVRALMKQSLLQEPAETKTKRAVKLGASTLQRAASLYKS